MKICAKVAVLMHTDACPGLGLQTSVFLHEFTVKITAKIWRNVFYDSKVEKAN